MFRLCALISVFALSGCLTTTKSTFTAENSVVAGASPEFRRLVDVWEAKAGTTDSPREVLDTEQRVIELNGQVVVEEAKEDGTAEYYSMGVLGDRPISCFVHDAQIGEVAERNGVTVEVSRDDQSQDAGPVPINADGEAEALHAFVRDAFQNGALACFVPPLGGLK